MTGFTRRWKSLGNVYIPGGVLLLSVASHGIVLRLPFPSFSGSEMLPNSEPELALSDGLDVVILPSQEAPPAVDSEAVEVTPAEEFLSELPEAPINNITAEPQLLEVSEPEVSEPEVSEPEVSAPLIPEPEVSEAELPELEASEPEVLASQVVEPEVSEPEVPQPAAETSTEGGSAFPHPEGAVEGCSNLSEECGLVRGTENFRQAARSYIEELRAKDYEVEEQDGLTEPGYKVYEVSSPQGDGSIEFLMVLDMNGATGYVKHNSVLSPDEARTIIAQIESGDSAG